MMHTQEMLRTHPQPLELDGDALVQCIEECYACAQACTTCADACLAEQNAEMLRRCIRINLDCFDVCVTTGNLLSRQTQPEMALLRAQVQACAVACRACGQECGKHAQHHEHCRICAESCQRCAEACDRLLGALGG